MNYGTIKNFDIANGEGVRVSLFVSGCTNRCPGCFQPETWDFHYGTLYTPETEQKLLEMLAPDFIQGLTILGGEPFEFENQPDLAALTQKVKETYPEKDIWIYTGFVLEDLLEGGKRHGPYTDLLLSNINVMIDGPFQQERKDPSLAFRGSSNQRVLNLPETLRSGKIIPYRLRVARTRR